MQQYLRVMACLGGHLAAQLPGARTREREALGVLHTGDVCCFSLLVLLFSRWKNVLPLAKTAQRIFWVFFPFCWSSELDGRRKRRLPSSSGESVEQQVRQEGEGCMSQHRESLDTAGLGRFSALPHCYLWSLLPREMPTCEDVGA